MCPSLSWFKLRALCPFQKWKPSGLQARRSLVVFHIFFSRMTQGQRLGGNIIGVSLPPQDGGECLLSWAFRLTASSLRIWLPAEYLFPRVVFPQRPGRRPWSHFLEDVCFSGPGCSLPSGYRTLIASQRQLSGVWLDLMSLGLDLATREWPVMNMNLSCRPPQQRLLVFYALE